MYGSSTDHNHVYLENNQIVLKACRINWDEGKSTANPHPEIHYHSGAIHSKETFTVNNQYPNYEIKGEFKAPYGPGTWPAFWLNGAWTWPPEIDILEFKGNNVNWFWLKNNNIWTGYPMSLALTAGQFRKILQEGKINADNVIIN